MAVPAAPALASHCGARPRPLRGSDLRHGRLGDTIGNRGNWTGGVLVIALITAAVHAATLDTDWKTGR
ncbi:hypothetical protein [Streptomyces sp. NPDC088923]|uniref:hypothetical protein n=1 Tax=Streptomyces sp. NPDC088923 TaxID=3365913 RepID=UPI00380C03AE